MRPQIPVEHNIHYAKCYIGRLRPSLHPHGSGWASGSALACRIVPPTRTNWQRDGIRSVQPH